jgi:hypothetical protein
MKTKFAQRHAFTLLFKVSLLALASTAAHGVTTVFFDISQGSNLVASAATSDTIGSQGYLFTVTRDKLFTGGIGLTNPVGRAIRIPWPAGLEAQAVTAGPVLSGAKITLKRQDQQPFAIQSFTVKLLANTGGAGASFEIMPKLNGEDGFPDPAMYDVTGYYGQNFTYNTPTLHGFDSYIMTLYVDYALMNLTVVDASIPPPILGISLLDTSTVQLSWPLEAAAYTLEFTTSLPPQAWNPVTDNVVTNGTVLTVDLPITGSKCFYRLRK